MSEKDMMIIPKFDGDYEHWAMLMENLLRSKEWWDLIETGITRPERGVILTGPQRTELAERTVTDHKVKNYLFASIDKTILKTILKKETSKDLWESMKRKYQGNERVQSAQLQRLRRSFEVLEMHMGETIANYFSRVMEVANNMRNLGEDIPDSKVVEKILRTLVEKFTYVVCAIEESNDIKELTVDGLQSSLMVHEQNLSRHAGEEHALKVEGQWKPHGNRGRGGRGTGRGYSGQGYQGRGRGTYNKDMVECYKCHKLGHYKAECPEWEKEANYVEFEEDVLLMAHVDISMDGNKHVWFLDSGCSNHMCGTKELFIELDSDFRQTVKLGDDRSLLVEGIGSLRLEINGITQVITSVYFVPGLKNNLFSVGQLQQKGLRVTIEDDACEIWHKQQKRVVMHSTMTKNRMFVIMATVKKAREVEEPTCLLMSGKTETKMVGEEKRFQMMQNLFGDESGEEEIDSEHESNPQPNYLSDEAEGGGEPEVEGEAEVEVHEEAEPESEGEQGDVEVDPGESEGEREQSSQEVDAADPQEDSEARDSDSENKEEEEEVEEEEEEHGERVATKRRRDVVESGSERSGDKHFVLREKRHKGCKDGDYGPGDVYLVGTGPGDPELLTLKAIRIIQSADLLLYDRVVSNDVLELVSPDAILLYVGKTARYHRKTQEEIHELLLSFAEAGATVVRLKGGDPLVFGRGGEEMDFLQQQGIRVQVIPGITAASGIAAELGIPLTHRGVATSVRFLTGHSRKGGTDPLFIAENAADPDTTLVVYMGLGTLPSLALKLMDHGLPCDTPAVAVERGTTPLQRTVFAELKDFANDIESAGLVSPTLIIIGKVVQLSPLWPHCSNGSYCLVETC